MRWIFAIALVTALMIAWVVFIRPWMRDKPWAKGFFEFIEPIELRLWRKSETILFARFKILVGVLITILTHAGAINIEQLMPFIPDQHEWWIRAIWNSLPLTISLLGLVDEQLRKDTTKPLEAVVVPETQPVPVAVTEAKEKLEAAIVEVKEKVAEAKAEGMM